MSYTIRVRVIQNEPTKWFSIVEKTVWEFAEGGTWAEAEGEHTLTMNGSGTSGTLRFKNPEGEYFLVALGVTGYKRWLDILPNLGQSNTGVQLHPKYYNNGPYDDVPRRLYGELSKDSNRGTHIAVKYYKGDGHDLAATITIRY